MKKNDLVRCRDTDRIGVVLDRKRAGFCMMILVQWPKETHWVDAVDLHVLDASV